MPTSAPSGVRGSQADQLPVVELTRLHWPLVGLDGGNQQRPTYGLGGGSVDQLGEPDQQPAGVITNRLHREEPGTAFVPKYLTGGKSPLRLIGAELHRDLAAYAVRPSDDANDYVDRDALGPLTSSSSQTVSIARSAYFMRRGAG